MLAAGLPSTYLDHLLDTRYETKPKLLTDKERAFNQVSVDKAQLKRDRKNARRAK